MHQFKSDSARWQALVARDPLADGVFVYCVRTTGIYCRPVCKARLARRANVKFSVNATEAENAGYRPCKRCRPELTTYTPESDKIDTVCQTLLKLERGQPLPRLEDMARLAGLTRHHFHRAFKRVTGLTPKVYLLKITHEADLPVQPPTNLVYSGRPNLSTLVTTSRSREHLEDSVPWQFNDHATSTSSSVSTQSQLQTAEEPVANMTESAECDRGRTRIPLQSDECCFITIYFTVTTTKFGTLSVAFLGDDICRLDLCSTPDEAFASLNCCFAAPLYALVQINSTNFGVNPWFQQLLTKG